MNPLDKVGKEIKAGSRIAYGRALGRSAALGLAHVVSTEWHKPKYAPPYWKITVAADNRSKTSVLKFPDRIVVLG